jgi:hypothetical protein
MLASRSLAESRRVVGCIFLLPHCAQYVLRWLSSLLLVGDMRALRYRPLCRLRTGIVLLQFFSVVGRGPVEVVAATLRFVP